MFFLPRAVWSKSELLDSINVMQHPSAENSGSTDVLWERATFPGISNVVIQGAFCITQLR